MATNSSILTWRIPTDRWAWQAIVCGLEESGKTERLSTVHISGLRRSPRKGNGYPLQYSCLENSMNRQVWRATVHWVAELDRTEQLSLSLSIVFQSFSWPLCSIKSNLSQKSGNFKIWVLPSTALIMFLSIELCGPHKTDFFSLTCFIYFPEIDSNVSYLPHSVNIDLWIIIFLHG